MGVCLDAEIGGKPLGRSCVLELPVVCGTF